MGAAMGQVSNARKDAHPSRSGWEEMLGEFRALGGTADNVRLGEGHFGRGLFPIDESKPVRIHIPETLLVDRRHARFEGGEFRLAPDAPVGPRERVFLEEYERNFSWGVRDGSEERLLRMMRDAPGPLQEILRTPFGMDKWLDGPPQAAGPQRFLDSRVIRYKDAVVIMPVVELSNHGQSTSYECEDGVEIRGRFSGEILVRYEFTDPLEIFKQWGFVSEDEIFALSLPVTIGGDGGSLVIGRNVGGDALVKGEGIPFFPQVSRDGNRIEVSYLMLGHKSYPRLARGIFYKIMRQAGVPGVEELFDLVQHINRMQLYRLMALSELAAADLGVLLRKAARCQLECLSSSIGTREV
jgi:hypothetical protein